jgi:predicted phage-related endonuclease
MAEQRSDEWHAQRAGKITASRFGDALPTKLRGTGSAERQRYMRELVFERTSGVAMHSITGKALRWGSDVETFARDAYELETGLIVDRAEFIVHPRYDFIGASPDGLVGTDGGIEMKCPHDETEHIETILCGMPVRHMPQVQGGMFVTGRAWWDFVSYDPRQRDGLRLYVQRVPRDDAYISKMAAALLEFDEEVRAMVSELEQRAEAMSK